MQELDNIFRVLSGPGSQAMGEVGLGGLVLLMLVSLASSLFIAWLYRYFYNHRASGSDAHRAFPLLGISITAIFLAIQFSLPLSLGLLGALSIVRFRTPIKEPEEIGFIMLVIASSLACATFKLAFLGVILAVGVVALVVQRYAVGLTASSRGGVVVVSIPKRAAETTGLDVSRLLGERLSEGRLESFTTNEDAIVVSYAFATLSPENLHELQTELQEKSADSTINVFFNRAAAV